MSKTSQEWWDETKNDGQKLHHWLQRQYVGEMAAVNLLSEVLLKYGGQATTEEWDNVYKVMLQEAKHARWMKRLLDSRGIAALPDGEHDQRYWKEVLPGVTNFREAMAAAFHAEHMRLERIRAIANDPEAHRGRLEDVGDVFRQILPDEEWHEEVFDAMRNGHDLTRYHHKGMEALNLTLA